MPNLRSSLVLPVLLIIDQVLKFYYGQINTLSWLDKDFNLVGIALLIVLSLYLTRKERVVRFPLGLVLTGVLSNSIDVLVSGGVKDYLPWFGYQTNLADIAIWLGLFWFSYSFTLRPPLQSR